MFKGFFYIFLALVFFSCSPKFYQYNTIESEIIRVDEQSESEKINAIIAPYKVEKEQQMSKALIDLPYPLTKAKPESTLTNFLSDAISEQIRNKLNIDFDFCVLNYGGIRIPELYAGEITNGLIYELLPFDNFLVVIELDHNKMLSFFDHMAKNGGWPISGNVKYQISKSKKEAQNIIIDNKAIDRDRKYKILLPDYIANGGDNCEMLKGTYQENTKVYLRDAIIEYLDIKEQIEVKLDKRVSYVE